MLKCLIVEQSEERGGKANGNTGKLFDFYAFHLRNAKRPPETEKGDEDSQDGWANRGWGARRTCMHYR